MWCCKRRCWMACRLILLRLERATGEGVGRVEIHAVLVEELFQPCAIGRTSCQDVGRLAGEAKRDRERLVGRDAPFHCRQIASDAIPKFVPICRLGGPTSNRKDRRAGAEIHSSSLFSFFVACRRAGSSRGYNFPYFPKKRHSVNDFETLNRGGLMRFAKKLSL